MGASDCFSESSSVSGDFGPSVLTNYFYASSLCVLHSTILVLQAASE
uniref:Uncharacterized protein n=1 Tax=Anguilla anguilla TaxID=7936 RepID=A0A0E9VSY0_ANGAN